jgi:hypothetical protein
MSLPLFLGMLLAPAAQAAGQLPTGVIAGQLRGSDGMPAAGVRLAAAEIQTQTGERNLVSIGRTDEAGRYRLEGVPPGRYWVVAGALTSPTYYPGALDSAGASAVTVAAGATVTDIDFGILAALNAMSTDTSGLAPAGRRPRIPGRFRIDDGRPLPPDFGDFHVWYGGEAPVVAQDGTFSIALSPAPEFVTVEIYSNRLIGDYYVKSMAFGSVDLLRSPLMITETAPSVDISLARGTLVSGTVLTETGAPAELTVFLIPQPRPARRPDLLRMAVADPQGHFEIFGVAPGEYRVSSANDNDPARETPALTVSGDAQDVHLTLTAARGLRFAPLAR